MDWGFSVGVGLLGFLGGLSAAWERLERAALPFPRLHNLDLPGDALIDQPIPAKERPPQDHPMPLLALVQLDAGEGLKQQLVQLRNIEARQVDEGAVATADAADLALVGDGQVQPLGQRIIDAVAAGAGVDQRLDLLFREVRGLAGRRKRLQPDIDLDRRPQSNEQICLAFARRAEPKARLYRAHAQVGKSSRQEVEQDQLQPGG